MVWPMKFFGQILSGDIILVSKSFAKIVIGCGGFHKTRKLPPAAIPLQCQSAMMILIPRLSKARASASLMPSSVMKE